MPVSLHKKNYLQLLCVCLCGFGLAWHIIHKAFTVSFTHDEAYTYTHYLHQGFMDIVSYKTPYTNNHILNTVLMKYSEVFFGSSEIALRLPNILAFIVYSLFAVLLLYTHCRKFLLPCYLLLTLNPYLLDFFALARGYGLSIAFLMMSVYYLSRFYISRKTIHLILFNAGAFLAVMSNFSLLNYYVAVLIIHNLLEFYIHKKSYHFFQTNKINIVAVIISGMVLYEPLRRISKMNLLDFGGKNGFLEDTVGTAIYSLFYEAHVPDLYMGILKSTILLVVIFTSGLIIFKLAQKDNLFFRSNTILTLCNLVLLAIAGITILQHLLMGNDYYVHRFALFFYPLFMLNFIFLICFVSQKVSLKIPLLSCYLIVSLLIYNLYINHNLIYFKDWKQDRPIKNIMQVLVSEHEKQPDKQIRLGINWLFEPVTNFYRYTWDLKWMNPTHRRGLSKYDDYILIFKHDKEFESVSTKPVLYSDELTGIVLLKNRN
ncbi:MAG: hypothetical protein V4677_05630 [Bacteroidota bacterium]